MLERIIWFITALTILALAFFFIATAIVVGAVLGAALVAKIWWTHRKIRQAAEDRILTTEYAVVERERQEGELLPVEADLVSAERQSRNGADPGREPPAAGFRHPRD
jgi:hypothetical protein